MAITASVYWNRF